MNTYRLHGTTVTSDLDLHLPPVTQPGIPDLTLRRAARPPVEDWEPAAGTVLAHLREADRSWYLLARTPSGYRLRFAGLCDFDLSGDLRRASWAVVPGADPSVAAILAAGTLIAFRLSMAGHLVLHASAVRVRGRGLAFVGRSGMGKSTMATLMCTDGAALLTDDVARVGFDGDDVFVSPGGPESRLRPAAAPLVDLLDSAAGTRATSDGRTAVSLPSCTDDAARLDAVIVPVPSRERGDLELSVLTASQALILLGQFPRILGWADPRVLDQQFNLLADLVERVPVHLAVVPWGPPFDPGTPHQLLDALGWPG